MFIRTILMRVKLRMKASFILMICILVGLLSWLSRSGSGLGLRSANAVRGSMVATAASEATSRRSVGSQGAMSVYFVKFILVFLGNVEITKLTVRFKLRLRF
jgi:hypothetical protein